MFVSCVCCALCRQRPLRRADHSFRGVLLSVYLCVCVCVCVCVCLIVCDLATTKMMLLRPELGCCAIENEKKISRCLFNLSVQRLGTGWTVRGSNPDRGEIFCTRPDRPWVSPSYTVCSGSFAGGGLKRPWLDVEHPPHLAQRLKKEWSHTSTHSLGLRGLFQGELYLYLFNLTASEWDRIDQ